MNVDETLDNILQLHFPQHYQEKKSQLETEALHNYRYLGRSYVVVGVVFKLKTITCDA